MASPAVAAGVLGSRQKNCNSCVQTKRRCDRRTPVCSRCAEKKVPCAYGKAKVSNHTENQATRLSSDTDTPQFVSPGVSLFDSVPPFEVGYLDNLSVDPMLNEPGSASQTVPGAFVSEEISVDSFMEFASNENLSLPNQWLVPVDENLAIERPGTPVDEEVTTSYQKMVPFCVSALRMRLILRE